MVQAVLMPDGDRHRASMLGARRRFRKVHVIFSFFFLDNRRVSPVRVTGTSEVGVGIRHGLGAVADTIRHWGWHCTILGFSTHHGFDLLH